MSAGNNCREQGYQGFGDTTESDVLGECGLNRPVCILNVKLRPRGVPLLGLRCRQESGAGQPALSFCRQTMVRKQKPRLDGRGFVFFKVLNSSASQCFGYFCGEIFDFLFDAFADFHPHKT